MHFRFAPESGRQFKPMVPVPKCQSRPKHLRLEILPILARAEEDAMARVMTRMYHWRSGSVRHLKI
jgi:hypothetical protein